MRNQLDDRLPLRLVVFDDKQMLRHVLDECRDFRERLVKSFLGYRLRQISHRAGLETLLPTLDSADDVNWYVTGARMMLEPLQHLPSIKARHVDVERDRIGAILVRRGEPAVTIETHDSLEALVV